MKKRGFTLIELLAVIVVLGVIALIAVPVTLNLINESRKNSFKSSVSGMIQSIQMYSVKYAGEELELIFPEKLDVIDFSGTPPTAGYVYVDKDGIISIIMYNEKYCGYRKSGEEDITVLERNGGSCPNSSEIDSIKELLGIN